MCDTIAIVENDRVFFAKNSDRDANEGQNLVWSPRRKNELGAKLKCTYIEIPDVEETYATLVSQPFWIWGGEMAANEHGVTIGNEAVFTKEPYEKEPGLIGMDLLRLGVERGATAKDAVDVITALLEQYGQGGGCGHENRKFAYHNSFIVADPTEAYVLETAGRQWEAEKIDGARSISNGLTIPEFAEEYSDFLYTHFSGCKIRQPRTQALGDKATSLADMIAILQDHGEEHEFPHYKWTHGGLHAPCVHAGGVLTSGQSTASWVAELKPGACQHWATATSAPCTSLFKPVAVDTPVNIKPATDVADDSLWWRHERLHRLAMRNPQELQPLYIDELRDVQTRWLSDPPQSAEAFAEETGLIDKWTEALQAHPVDDVRPGWARGYWKKRDSRAGLDLHLKDSVIVAK